MNYLSELSTQPPAEAMYHDNREQLEQQIAMLTEWKHRATVQLEHFRVACSIYNFCDTHQLHELLRQ